MRRNWVPDEASKIKIVQGLLAMRRDGHFHALWVNQATVKVQFEPHGPIRLMGWTRAAEMVATAKRAAARALENSAPPSRLPPESERASAAQTLKAKAVGA